MRTIKKFPELQKRLTIKNSSLSRRFFISHCRSQDGHGNTKFTIYLHGGNCLINLKSNGTYSVNLLDK